MELLETILQNSLLGRTKKIETDVLLIYAKEDCNMFISALFHSVDKLIEKSYKEDNLYNIDYMFDYLEIIKENEKIDKTLLKKKITKLNKRIEYIKEEKLKNKKKQIKKLETFQRKLEDIKNEITKDNKDIETDFITYLIEKPRELNYIDLVFDKMPEVMKIKDNTGSSLYRNIIEKYLESLENYNEKEVMYYKKLLLLITSKKDFKISDKEKSEVLLETYNKLEKLSNKKKTNKDKIKEIINLKNIIIEEQEEVNINNIASKYNIEINFDNNIIDNIKNNNFELVKDNRKKINDYIISIDADNTVEIDDALSCRKLENGNYLLGVHIASILGYFNYESDIVQNAFNRIHSIYLHNKDLKDNNMIPIFPLEFSKDKASLVEGKDRLTRSYLFEIDKDGNIVSKEFLKTIINNNKKTTYDEVNNIIKNGSDNKELEITINNLKAVTEILSTKYAPNEVYELIKESSEDTSDLKVKRHGSEQIVYQSMLLTGNKVAEFFAENNYPCLYRVHKVEDKVNKKIESLINGLVNTYGGEQKKSLYKLLSGIYPKGTYDIKGAHSGLGLEHYCHCTSGLRRSADILVEHALEICYDKKPTNIELKKLHDEVIIKRDLIKSKEKEIDWFIKDFNKTYHLRKQ